MDANGAVIAPKIEGQSHQNLIRATKSPELKTIFSGASLSLGWRGLNKKLLTAVYGTKTLIWLGTEFSQNR